MKTKTFKNYGAEAEHRASGSGPGYEEQLINIIEVEARVILNGLGLSEDDVLQISIEIYLGYKISELALWDESKLRSMIREAGL